MKRLFFVLLLCAFSTGYAQNKCSMETRHVLDLAAHSPKNGELLTSKNMRLFNSLVITPHENGYTVGVLAKVASTFDRSRWEQEGIRIGSQIGDIVTLTVPLERLETLDQAHDIIYYEIAHKVAPLCNNTRFDTHTDSVHAGAGLPQPINGDGVIIGITDWGFDYTHVNFNNGSDDNHRILRAWDQFKTSGPAPNGFDYGTEFVGYDQLIEAQCDTFGLYGYGTHGSHVAGIAAGKGVNNGTYQGQAPKANLLLASFLLGENAWLDAVAWMKQVAEAEGKRLVINSSWGMYTFSNLDGTSLLSQAINRYSDDGIVFVTSGGNNGDANCHISKTFTPESPDTLRTVATYYSEGVGQALILWGEEGCDFDAAFGIYKNGAMVTSDFFSTADSGSGRTGYVVIENDTIGYDVMWEHSNFNNHTPHILMNVDKVSGDQLRLFVTATNGTVHAWNICNLENHAGNMGMDFTDGGMASYSRGDRLYGVGEPGCAAKAITVAAHNADKILSSGTYKEGDIAYFSSRGPLPNGMHKPEISAPGVNVISSLSSFTTESYPAKKVVMYGGRKYIFAEMSGTSMSSPAVTGIVALILQANPTLTVDEIRDILFTTARNDTRTGNIHQSGTIDNTWGWGKADAYAAVTEALSRLSIDNLSKTHIPMVLFPNPTRNRLTIISTQCPSSKITIYSHDGRTVWQGTVNAEIQLDISHWNNGIYIAVNETSGEVGKIVKID